MKVLSLSCERGHGFEGWFASEQAFVSQFDEGLVTCPLCESAQVVKLPSAPRLNLSAPRPRELENASATRQPGSPRRTNDGTAPSVLAPSPAAVDELFAAYSRAVRHVLATTEDVGDSFASEARKIHAGDSSERRIRGQATREEARELAEDGIEVMPFVVPRHLKEPLQ